MTAQMSDYLKHNRRKYDIVALSAAIPFEPQDYGIEPHAFSTACWRGYWCEYIIRKEQLYLQNLYVYNKDGHYPELNKVSIAPEEFETRHYRNNETGEIESYKAPKLHGQRVYKKVQLPIPYTGKILAGKEFLWDYYIHMGFQRPYAFKTLKEYVFENGILQEETDHSNSAEEIRKTINLKKYGFEREDKSIPQFVHDSFSLDYKTKAWWL